MAATPRKHVLIIALPAYGHLIPLLELGRKVVKYHDVTFAVSHSRVADIKARELASEADFPFYGIPDGFVETNVQLIDRTEFAAMMEKVLPAIRKLLETVPTGNDRPSVDGPSGITRPVDVVIGDNIAAPSLRVCHDRDIPYYFFNTAAASLTLGCLIVDENYPTIPESEEDILKFMEMPPPNAPPPPMSVMFKQIMMPIRETMPLVKGIVFNSIRSMEAEMLAIIQSFPIMKDLPVYFVGPLVPETEKVSVAQLDQQEKVRKWLDRQAERSVVYVSFGSVVVPMTEQLAEIAKGLRKTGKPFIWSVPTRAHHELPDDIASKIAGQFETEDSDFLILPWAPQKLILQHPATAVFVSHCGWNSTLESVATGVPVVGWPMFGDQKLNAEWLVDRKMAVMVEEFGLKPKRVLTAAELESAIRRVGWNGDSADTSYRQAALEWKQKAATGPGSDSNLDILRLVSDIQS
ncbi:putative UDP-glycosyltransferase 85A1 [Hypsibius exemplaris]|uniref:UDP-glucuronosyltransferase n=1 Tax=Hypsibius exemplaris TaxID=2072580 RepID=A0A9X6RMH2_HYPEX|nr:putative UDP-glycosyltransferase 85A1 [Hypsibius exemplaris]